MEGMFLERAESSELGSSSGESIVYDNISARFDGCQNGSSRMLRYYTILPGG